MNPFISSSASCCYISVFSFFSYFMFLLYVAGKEKSWQDEKRVAFLRCAHWAESQTGSRSEISSDLRTYLAPRLLYSQAMHCTWDSFIACVFHLQKIDIKRHSIRSIYLSGNYFLPDSTTRRVGTLRAATVDEDVVKVILSNVQQAISSQPSTCRHTLSLPVQPDCNPFFLW